jgi:hypothetical protein
LIIADPFDLIDEVVPVDASQYLLGQILGE